MFGEHHWRDLGWVDWGFIAVLALSVLVGLVRGVVFELLSLAGWLVAWFAAQWFADDVAPYLPVGQPGSALNHAVALIACFVAVLIVWGLLARVVRMLVRATPLSLPDRALGAAFGLLRGGLLLLAVASIVALTPAARSPGWRQSHGAAWLEAAVQGMKPLLPSRLGHWLPA